MEFIDNNKVVNTRTRTLANCQVTRPNFMIYLLDLPQGQNVCKYLFLVNFFLEAMEANIFSSAQLYVNPERMVKMVKRLYKSICWLRRIVD